MAKSSSKLASGVKLIFRIVLFLFWFAFIGWYILTLMDPIPIFRKDPAARIFVDGQQLAFERGTAHVIRWKPSFLVEVRSARGTERRIIYPWSLESDSGSISVNKDHTDWELDTSPVE